MSKAPEVTVVVPSYNQGQFLEDALASIFEQPIDMEVFVMDGGSTDNSINVIKKWESKLSGWKSEPDEGQAAAINAGVLLGKAPFVCWLNSDDIFMKDGLAYLLNSLKKSPKAPAIYANCWHINEKGERKWPYLTLPFVRYFLANYCFIAQPATLMRRDCWDAVGGLDQNRHMAMDYDLWWKLANRFGNFAFTSNFCAANRMHDNTKTYTQTDLHYEESIDVVHTHFGRVPFKWYWMKPVTKIMRRLTSVIR